MWRESRGYSLTRKIDTTFIFILSAARQLRTKVKQNCIMCSVTVCTLHCIHWERNLGRTCSMNGEVIFYIYMPVPVAARSEARQLRSRVRIPPGAWVFVCCECRVLSGRGLCDELITRPEESYRLWCVVVCDLETSRMMRPWPALGRSATGQKYLYTYTRARTHNFSLKTWWNVVNLGT